MIGALARRDISAEALVRRCLARIEEREPLVQAWEALDAEGALAEARRIDALADRPPLCGLPVGVKDIIETAALPTSYGSPLFAGHRPQRDAECVRRLRAAGAVVLGKTVTTEFAVYSPGRTRNPHALDRTPGGSSSGSAAAVADGMAEVALGTQTAASVIRPASFCGVLAYKPRFGAASMEGVRPIAPSLDTLGFFARDLDDVAPVLAALTGASVAPAARVRLSLCRTEQWPKAEPWARAAVEKLVEEEVALPEGLAEAQTAIMGAEAARSFHGVPEAGMSEKLRGFLAEGRARTAEELRDAFALAAHGRSALARVFDSGIDALVSLAAAGEAPGLKTTGDPAFSRIWTLLGAPSMSLPLLRGPSGLPMGVQIVAATDAALLGAAYFFAGPAGGFTTGGGFTSGTTSTR